MSDQGDELETVTVVAERADDGRGPVFVRCPEPKCTVHVFSRDGTGKALVTSLAVHLYELHSDAWTIDRALFGLHLVDPDKLLPVSSESNGHR